MFNKKNKINVLVQTLVLFFLLLAIDQFIKYKIHQNGGFYICNEGISFGVPILLIFFWLFLGIFLILTLSYCKNLLNNNQLNKFNLFFLVLIISGAISNAIDRFLFGCVIDFINVNISIIPIFNFADIFIFLGCSFFLLGNITKKH